MSNTIDVVLIGLAGVPGPPPVTSLTGAFTMPAVSASATATVGTTAWMVVGGYVQMAGAGVLQIVSIASLGAVVLSNTGASGNAAPGTVIEAGAQVGVAGSPGAALTLPTQVGVASMAPVQLLRMPQQRVPYDTTTATIPFLMPIGPNVGDTVTLIDQTNPNGNPGGSPIANIPTVVDPSNPIQVQQAQGAILLTPAGTAVPLPAGASVTWMFSKNTLYNVTYWAAI